MYLPSLLFAMDLAGAYRCYHKNYVGSPEDAFEWTEAQQCVYEQFHSLLEELSEMVDSAMITQGEYLDRCNELVRRYRDPIYRKIASINMLRHIKDIIYWNNNRSIAT